MCVHVCNGPLQHSKSTTKEQIIKAVQYKCVQKSNILLLCLCQLINERIEFLTFKDVNT